MKKDQINLTRYTKSDLIWIINYMSQLGNDRYLQYALAELTHKKELERIEEADKYAAISHQKRTEFIALLSPFDGKPWNEIPRNIIAKCTGLMGEAEAADKKYMQLMSRKE